MLSVQTIVKKQIDQQIDNKWIDNISEDSRTLERSELN